MKKIDVKLIKILKSETTNKDLISNIKYLINANVLDHIETQLCEKVLEQIELIGIPDLEGALKQLNIDSNAFNNILGYEKLEILEKIDDLILLRKEIENKKIQSMASEKVSKGIIDKEIADIFLNRYVEAIHIKENNVLEKLINLKDEESTIDISTSNLVTDNIMGGLENGTVTTITGNKVYTLRNGEMNKYVGLFLCTILNKEDYRYSYGRARIISKLKEEIVKLPVQYNSDGTIFIDEKHKYSEEGYVPDWQFMEDYIKSLPYGDRL